MFEACLFIYNDFIYQNCWEKYQNFRSADDTTPKAESEEELKNLLMRVKEESENAGLKLNIQKWRSWHLVPSLYGKEKGKEKTVIDFIFLGSEVTADSNYSHEIKRHLLLRRKAMTDSRQRNKMQRHHFADKCLYSQSYVFSSSHVWMWELDHKEGWVQKNRCFQIVLLL